MRLKASVLSRLAAGLFLGLSLASASPAQSPVETLSDTVARVEERLGARVGLSLVETGSELSWAHREHERFAMNSTMKTPLCAAVLARGDAGELALTDTLRVTPGDILSYAPVTKGHVGSEMTIAELCLAALDMSDNTATNLLLDHIGGPPTMTALSRT